MMHNPLEQLHTEQRNTSTIGIASCTTLEMLEKINDEDQKVAAQVRKALPDVARAVELIVERMRHGGRLVYAGAGTSGRLGYMDAAECRPTYGIAENKVSCVMAGGRDAVFSAKESLEDDRAGAREDLAPMGACCRADVVVAAAASGAHALLHWRAGLCARNRRGRDFHCLQPRFRHERACRRGDRGGYRARKPLWAPRA